MIILRGTQRFRARVPGPQAGPGDMPTALLGEWYATLLRWRRPAALLVEAGTLLPLITPLAPAKTLLRRLPDAIAELLAAHHVPAPLVDAERAHAAHCRLTPTANRSVVGVMNEFAFLAGHQPAAHDDLLRLSVQLARTPCSPLYEQHVSPDRALAALVAAPTRDRARPAP